MPVLDRRPFLSTAAAASDGTWKPIFDETVRSRDGKMFLTLPAYSAASAHFI
jgi:hypothetical protein